LGIILGLQVKRDRSARTLHLSQKPYINTVLERFDMLGCKPAKSPLRSKTVMSRKEGEEKADQSSLSEQLARSCMPCLVLDLISHTLLVYSVDLRAIHLSHTGTVVLSVFKYLKHTSDLGITYSGGCEQLDGYSDADFATGDVDRRRVTSGYVFRLWGAISWQSKKQPSVSLATGDAKYVALAQAARELMWLRSIMTELGFSPSKPITLYGDNQASISIAKNPVGHTRAKQIDIRFLSEGAGRAGRCLDRIYIDHFDVGRWSDQTSRSGCLCSIPRHAWSADNHTSIGQGTSSFVNDIVRHHCLLSDRAHYVRDHGHTACPGCITCKSLGRDCIILPSSDARKLNKCSHCTLSKQKCSMTVR